MLINETFGDYAMDALVEKERRRARDLQYLIARISIFSSTFTLFINCLHLFFLVDKDLRKLAVFVIMLAVCICDILSAFVSVAFSMSRIVNYKTTEYCYLYGSLFNVELFRALGVVGTATANASLWLVVMMAAYRSLSSLFPMSNFTNTLGKVRTAVVSILVILLYHVASECFELYFLNGVYKRWDNDTCHLIEDVKTTKADQYMLAVHISRKEWSNTLNRFHGITVEVQIFLYVTFTILLLVAMGITKKRRSKVINLESAKKDNSTKLVLTMIIFYLIFQSFGVVADMVFSKLPDTSIKRAIYDWVDNVVSFLAVLHSSTHFFICYFISTMYRTVVKSEWNKWKRKKEKVPIITIKALTAKRTAILEFTGYSSLDPKSNGYISFSFMSIAWAPLHELLLALSTRQWAVEQSILLQQRDGSKCSIMWTLHWMINVEMDAPVHSILML
uniref:G_PROTEIN_RECEP_F1_2 domain-containing protein n=1 Tax=Caenorhabditis japonica TaxID=281687 RepID=A0A8R1HX20_CAEJA